MKISRARLILEAIEAKDAQALTALNVDVYGNKGRMWTGTACITELDGVKGKCTPRLAFNYCEPKHLIPGCKACFAKLAEIASTVYVFGEDDVVTCPQCGSRCPVDNEITTCPSCDFEFAWDVEELDLWDASSLDCARKVLATQGHPLKVAIEEVADDGDGGFRWALDITAGDGSGETECILYPEKQQADDDCEMLKAYFSLR